MHGAWRSTAPTNSELIENLWRNGMLKSPVAKAAFLRVDRGQYCPSGTGTGSASYQDRPQGIGHGATISAPHMHCNAVESLLGWILPMTVGGGMGGGASSGGGGDGFEANLEGVEGRPRRVLDIGSGSGYLTHVLAELVGEDGVVVGVEHIRELKELGEGNMRKSSEGRALLDSGRVRFRVGDGRRGWMEPRSEKEGEGEMMPGVGGAAAGEAGSSDTDLRGSEEGGWDAIHVGAAAVTMHEELLQQLRSPGRLFIPVADEDSGDQYIWTVDKDVDGKITKKKLYGVRYVPLTDAPRK